MATIKKYPVQRADGRRVLVTVPPRPEDELEHMSAQAQGDYYRERGEWSKAAQAYHIAFMQAGGHRFAEMMRARAQECQAKADAMTTKHTPTPEYLAGGRAAQMEGRFPVYRNYNYGTNLTPGYEVVALADTQDAANKVTLALNSYASDQEVIKGLVEAAKKALPALKAMAEKFEVAKVGPSWTTREMDVFEAIGEFERAIAKAEASK